MAIGSAALVDVLTWSAKQALLAGDGPICQSSARVELERLGAVDALGRLTELGAELRRHLQRVPARGRSHKYAAVACYVTAGLEIVPLETGRSVPPGARRFDSLHEGRRWIALRRLELAGEIEDLRCQVEYPLYAWTPNGRRVQVAAYKADFTYRRRLDGELVVEDTKGYVTQVYRLKRRWLEAQEGIQIQEIRREPRARRVVARVRRRRAS